MQYLVLWQKNYLKKNELVEKIKNRWSNLKDEIEKMSEDGKETEQPDKILKIVEEILDFNLKKAENKRVWDQKY